MDRYFAARLVLLVAFCIGGTMPIGRPLSVYAEEAAPQPSARLAEELELMKEEESVSIASRYEQPISQAPSNVYVITDEDVRQSGATDIPTILRRIPGIDVMQVTGADFNVSVRGDNQLEANKLLVMVDGRPIYIDAQAVVFWKLIPVTLPEIKRIEVSKGPAAAVYGFNAFDGIINIITKSAAEMRGTTLQFGGGEFGTISSAAIHAGTTGSLGYRLSVGQDQTQQWRNRDALAFRARKLNVDTTYSLPDDARVKVSGGFVDSNRFDGLLTELSNSNDKPSQGYMHAVYERPNFFVRSFWNRFSGTNAVTTNPVLSNLFISTDRNGNVAGSTVADTYNIEAQHSFDIATVHRFTYGANYRRNTVSSNFLVPNDGENRLGFYVQDEWRPAPVVTLVAGGRYDLDTFINPAISPRLAVLYTPLQDHTFRAAASVSYRPPTLFERNIDSRAQIIPFGVTTVVVPSHTLKPEKIVSYELSYQGWYLKHRLRVRTDLFFNHITDLINFRGVAPGFASAVNDSGQADIYGGEFGMEFLATHWLTGFANYAYEQIGQSFTDTARRGAPRSKINAGLRGDWENGVSGEIGFYHVEAATYSIAQTFTLLSPFLPTGATVPDTRVGSYNLLNLRTGYKFWKQKAEAGYLREAEVAISAFNALNDKHKEHPLGDTIGSRVMGWLTIRF